MSLFGLAPIVGLIINVAIMAGTYLLSRSRQPRDRRADADGFVAGDNPSDPRQPIRVVYGRPVYLPPVLSDYALPTAVNRWASDDSPGRVTVLSVGAGPVDGGDAQLWIDDIPTSIQVDETDPTASQTLRRETGGKRYAFPKKNVVKESVSIYVDGELYGAYSEAAGTVQGTTEVERTRTAKTRYFTTTKDDQYEVTNESENAAKNKPTNLLTGFLIPDDGAVTPGSVQVEIEQSWPPVSIKFQSKSRTAFSRSVKVPADDIHVARTTDDKSFVWIGFKSGGGYSARNLVYTVAYRVMANRVVIETDDAGTSYAVFENDPGEAAVVTAIYKAGKLADSTSTHFRPGTPDQDVLPIADGVRSTINVGGKLTQGAPLTHSTTNAVDDIEIGVQSGPSGMFELSKTGSTRVSQRNIEIQIKQTDADDTRSSGNKDVTAGWVRLAAVNGGGSAIGDSTRGTATWTFSLAKLWTKAAGHNPPRTSLPFAFYDVEVVALDAANTDETNAIYFSYATEIQRDKLTIPHHSTYTVEVTDPDVVGRAPTYALGIMGRRVWVPDSTAVYDTDTERPEPGTHKWTRNPVWCACDLIVDKHFGGGQFYTWQNINLAEALNAAAFCDATVANANGTTETRSEVDVVLDTRMALSRQIMRVLAGSQVLGALTGGIWRFLPDVDSEPVMDLTDADYRVGQIQMTYSALENTPNEVAFDFPNELLDFELDSDTLATPGSEPAQRVTRTVSLDGVRRRSQAVRAASLLLRQLHLQRRTVELTCSGWRALQLEAGDVVTLTSPELKQAAKKYRVQSIEFGSNLVTKLRLGEHDSSAYSDKWLGPVGGVLPNHRPLPAGTSSEGTVTTVVGSNGLAKVTYSPFSLAKLTATRITETPSV